MYDEKGTTYMEPQGLQGLSTRSRASWNPVSSASSALSRIVPSSTPTGSRLGAYSMAPSYNLASPRTVRKIDVFDISEDDKHDVKLAFELFDSRKVGRLCYRDLKAAIKALDGTATKAEVRKLMNQYSKDDDGEIGRDEFLQIMTIKYREKDSQVNIGRMFAVFDEEGTGRISFKNLRKVARDLGKMFTDKHLEAMIQEFDMDGDGEVTQMKFFEIMKKHQNPDPI